MNTIAITASTNTILAIDLGKYKSVACAHDPSSGEISFTTFETTRHELQKLLARRQSAAVIIEACLLAGWVHDLCSRLGVRCLVANTASEARKFKHLKRKTDKDDALRLAQLPVLGQLPTVTLPPSRVRQWRSLIAARQNLVGRRVAVQNRIRAIFVAQGLPAPRGAKLCEFAIASYPAHQLPGTCRGEHHRRLSGNPCAPPPTWRPLHSSSRSFRRADMPSGDQPTNCVE